MVSAVGADELGDRARSALGRRAVDFDGVHVDQQRPTGTVDVTLDASGSASYVFADGTAWDHLPWSDTLEELAAETDAVCFGTLGQRSPDSRETIRRFVTTCPPAALRVLDVNLRPPFDDETIVRESLEIANVVKLNEDELPVVSGLADVTGTPVEQLRGLCTAYDLKAIALTRGADGAILVRHDETSERPSPPADVVDTVGAGDSFTAAFVVGLLIGSPLDVINDHAARVAAYVCSQPGGTPAIPPSLQFPGL